MGNLGADQCRPGARQEPQRIALVLHLAFHRPNCHLPDRCAFEGIDLFQELLSADGNCIRFSNQVRRFFRDGDCGGVGVAADDDGHDRGIDHA